MCLAILGKIKKIKSNNLAEVYVDGVSLDANIELVDVKIGDSVMIHAGFAIQKVNFEDTKELEKLLNS
ncbi:MAG: HypC/HybG/HupF family hydrogenase formation chaperone [bacterium]